MKTGELIVRLVMMVPLLFITWKVWQIRTWLPSAAWNFIMLGVGGFAVINVIVLLFQWPPGTPGRITATLLAYLFVAYGFHTLHKDIIHIVKSRRKGEKQWGDSSRQT